MDVIFLSYANSQTSPLKTLLIEDESVYRALMPRALKQHFLIHRDSFTSISKIAEYITLYRNHIKIFHYGGHADRDALLLDTEEARALGLAQMLGQCPNLKLVVLNGCSTKEQVFGLLDAGIPAVIATSAPVEDKKASRFATRFYQGLSEYLTIEQAFELAIGEIATIDKNIADQMIRGIGKLPERSNAPVWGIFSKPGREAVLEEKLPVSPMVYVPSDYTPNELLLESLEKALIPHNESLRILSKSPTASLARKRMAVINTMPAPIAEHLRRLLVPLKEEEGYNKVSVNRLRQIVGTYQIMMELVVFILLAQMWEVGISKGRLEASREHLHAIRDFLFSKSERKRKFDYINLIRNIRKIIGQNGGEYFIKELTTLKELLYQDNEFQKGCFFLETLRVNLEEIEPETGQVLVELCIRAEESLSELLKETGFLAKYALMTIQEIDVLKYRHKHKASFRHVVVILRDLLGGLEVSPIELDRFMDNRSIVLMNEKTMEFLNLTPFIIDQEAFEKKHDLGKLFAISHYDESTDTYWFNYLHRPNDESARLPVTKKHYPIVKEQFDAFKELLEL